MLLYIADIQWFFYSCDLHKDMSNYLNREEIAEKTSADSFQAVQKNTGHSLVMPKWWHKLNLIRENVIFTKESVQ